MLNNVLNYSFLIVAIGTILLSISTAIIGSINVYLKQSLIGDALGHATLLGIVIFNVFFATKNSVILLIGACISALIAYFMIDWLKKVTTLNLDVILGIVLTTFFSLGLVIKTGTTTVANINIITYIFGQAAFITLDDVILIATVTLIILLGFLLFYRVIQSYLFDKQFVYGLGWNTKIIDLLILISSVVILSLGLKVVGIILVTSFLILPTVFAQNFSNSYKKAIVIAILFSSINSFVGTYLSSTIPNLSTGSTIVVLMASLTLISMFRRSK